MLESDHSSALRSGLMAERKTAAYDGPAVLAREFERSVERAHPLMHARQASAEAGSLRKSDAVIGNLDRDLFGLDPCRDVYRRRRCVPQHVGDAFLDDAIGGLRQQTIQLVQTRI